MSSFPLHGLLPASFDNLRAVIEHNYAEHDELGFQFCVMQHGEPLIDIRSGWTDRKKTEEVAEDTLFAVFSSGKAMAALVIAWLVEEDCIGYDQLVETIWPEEIAYRADPEQRSLGRILREEIAAAANTADVWIGLPPSEHARCAQMQKPKALADMGDITDATRWAFLKKWSSPGGMGVSAWREAELAGSNCHATAKGLAALMHGLFKSAGFRAEFGPPL